MKILIHALGIVQGGGLTHLQNFLLELDKTPDAHEYSVFIREACSKKIPHLSRICIQAAPDYLSRGLFRFWVDNVEVPKKIRSERYDLLISMANFGPVKTRIPHIIFQRNTVYYEPKLFHLYSLRTRLNFFLIKRYIFYILKNADLIVAPSHEALSQIFREFPAIQAKRRRCLYHAVNELESVRETPRRNTQTVKFFYPAHAYPHKGFSALLKIALAAKKEGKPYEFFLTTKRQKVMSLGRCEKSILEQNDLSKHVIFVGEQTSEEIKEHYATSDFLIFPSHLESFGFPLVEAMMQDLSIIASDTPINREICGQAASYFCVTEPETALQVIEDALSAEGALRLKKARMKQISSFDWSWKRYISEFRQMVAEFEPRHVSGEER